MTRDERACGDIGVDTYHQSHACTACYRHETDDAQAKNEQFAEA